MSYYNYIVQIQEDEEHNVTSLDDRDHELSKHHNISGFSDFVLLNICDQSPTKFPFLGMSCLLYTSDAADE